MDEEVGTYACDVCGQNAPHDHQPEEVWMERYARPAFERWCLTQWTRGYHREQLHALASGLAGAVGIFDRWQSGEYKHTGIGLLWSAWQAAWLCLPDRMAPFVVEAIRGAEEASDG